MISFPLVFQKDNNDTVLVTCPLLPEVTTFGVDQPDALTRGREAVEEAVAARMAEWQDVPIAPRPAKRSISLSLLANLKLELYLACKAAHVSRAELARRLGWHREQVDRLFRLDHASRVDQIEAAMHAVGQDIEVRALKRA
jgi:antitoxin HicB